MTVLSLCGDDGVVITDVISDTERHWVFRVAEHKNCVFYVRNDDDTDSMDVTMQGYYAKHEEPRGEVADPHVPDASPLISIQTATAVATEAYSVPQQVDNADAFTHVLITLVRSAAADISGAAIYGWGMSAIVG